jgi:hypothetical protein
MVGVKSVVFGYASSIPAGDEVTFDYALCFGAAIPLERAVFESPRRLPRRGRRPLRDPLREGAATLRGGGAKPRGHAPPGRGAYAGDWTGPATGLFSTQSTSAP